MGVLKWNFWGCIFKWGGHLTFLNVKWVKTHPLQCERFPDVFPSCFYSVFYSASIAFFKGVFFSVSIAFSIVSL